MTPARPEATMRINDLSSDGRLVLLSAGARNFAYGSLSVMLALFLEAQGLGADLIGLVFASALAGGAVVTVVVASVADRVGRRLLLIIGALLMSLAGSIFAISSSPALLVVAAIAGTISPSGKEVGPFSALEQAILPQTTNDEHRTRTFAVYNLVASLCSALGALTVGIPTLLGMSRLEGYRAILWSYVATGLLLAALFSQLSPAVEVKRGGLASPHTRFGLHKSRGVVARLAALFALDAFAGGFVVQGILSYWFYLRYGVDTTALGAIFFAANLLAALSFLAAAPLARRIGLLNTMVFTHLPSNILLMLVPLMPGAPLAVAMLLARYLLSQLDVPTRQSYTMAVVAPDERAAAAGITSVARNAATALAPVFSGATLAVPSLGLPFLIAGGLKVLYDLAILATFRHLRPPEESRGREQTAVG